MSCHKEEEERGMVKKAELAIKDNREETRNTTILAENSSIEVDGNPEVTNVDEEQEDNWRKVPMSGSQEWPVELPVKIQEGFTNVMSLNGWTLCQIMPTENEQEWQQFTIPIAENFFLI